VFWFGSKETNDGVRVNEQTPMTHEAIFNTFQWANAKKYDLKDGHLVGQENVNYQRVGEDDHEQKLANSICHQ